MHATTSDVVRVPRPLTHHGRIVAGTGAAHPSSKVQEVAHPPAVLGVTGMSSAMWVKP
jgi:hypothetical protein